MSTGNALFSSKLCQKRESPRQCVSQREIFQKVPYFFFDLNKISIAVFSRNIFNGYLTLYPQNDMPVHFLTYRCASVNLVICIMKISLCCSLQYSLQREMERYFTHIILSKRNILFLFNYYSWRQFLYWLTSPGSWHYLLQFEFAAFTCSSLSSRKLFTLSPCVEKGCRGNSMKLF